MGNEDSLLLAELMCTRLCHDLAGPIGGAMAGAELLGEETGALPPELVGLLGASVEAASRHLRFLRAAFGRGGPSMSAEELRELAEGFLRPARDSAGPALAWEDDGPAEAGPWGKEHGKLVLNLVLAARDTLAVGGEISVAVRRTMPWRVRVEARGRLASAADDVLMGLGEGPVREMSPRAAQALFMRRLAQALGGDIHGDRHADGVMFLAETAGPAAG